MVYLSFNGREFESPSITEIIKGSSSITKNIKSYKGFVVKYLLRQFHLVVKYCRCMDNL
jgi:hypothetical protein